MGRSRSPRRKSAPFQLLRLILDNQMLAQRLLGMLDIPTRCSLFLVAKREHTLLAGSLSLVFQEYCAVVVRIFREAPMARHIPRHCCCSQPSRGSLASRNGFLVELSIFYGYPELALLFLGQQQLPDVQWAAIIAVVMNRPQVFAEERLWLGGVPILGKVVALARALDRDEVIPLLPPAQTKWHYCQYQPRCWLKDVPSQLVHCVQFLYSLADE